MLVLDSLKVRVQSQREDILGPVGPIIFPSGGSRRHSTKVEIYIRSSEVTFVLIADKTQKTVQEA